MFDHLYTFLWLRWRIRSNQLRASSPIGKAFAALMLTAMVLSSSAMLVLGFSVGAILPRYLPSGSYFLIWDVVAFGFTLVWLINVVTELQRSDAITFDRILQLPVTYWHAFAVNYLSSLFNFPFLCMLTLCLGLIAGSVLSVGIHAVILLLPCTAFLFALTALTYQLQGWLSTMMTSPRKRRFVMIIIPFVIIVLIQIPVVFINRIARNSHTRTSPPVVVEQANPSDSSETSNESEPSTKSASDSGTTPANATDIKVSSKFSLEKFIALMQSISLFIPLLWLASSAHSIEMGNFHFVWQSTILCLLAYLSLRRNFRKTIEFYLGQTGDRPKHVSRLASSQESQVSQAGVLAPAMPTKLRLVEWQIPLVNDNISAVVTMTWQSMLRAPEAKMFMVLPFVFSIAMLGVLHSVPLSSSNLMKSALSISGCGFALLVASGLLGNQFGFDRTGFRAFVLSPIPREEILFGKNFAAIPFFVFQIVLLQIGLGWITGISVWNFLSSLIVSLSLIPLFALLFNLMSILAPFPIASGTIQPKHFDLTPVFFSFLLTSIVPFIIMFGMLPVLIEYGLNHLFPRTSIIPISFLLAWPYLILALFIYRWLLPWEGKLLAKREKEILRIVTSRIE